MATTLMPLDPATSPQHASRILSISARLLPDEVIAARRAHRVRGLVIVILAVVLVGLGSWYAFAQYQVAQADDELTGVNADAQTLQHKQLEYADVVNTQSRSTMIANQLATLMANDLRWAALVGTLRTTAAASGIQLDGVNGQLNTGADGTGVLNNGGLPSTTTQKIVGTVSVTGTAPDKVSLARYVDALSDTATVKVVADPYLTSATEGDDKKLQFTLKVTITASALGGRFSKPATTGGK
jgi:hypothetical protein